MKLKNILLLISVVLLVVAIAGCSSDNNGEGVKQVKASEPQTTSEAQATPTVTPDVKGSLKNPAGSTETVSQNMLEVAMRIM